MPRNLLDNQDPTMLVSAPPLRSQITLSKGDTTTPKAKDSQDQWAVLAGLRSRRGFVMRTWSVLWLVAVGAIIMVAAAFVFPAKAKPTRIDCIGDSITWGYNTPGGYRSELADRLDAADFNVQFVGTVDTPGGWSDGHRGYAARDIAPQVRAWIAQSKPNIALLMAGTNDFRAGSQETPEQALGYERQAIDAIRTADPKASVYVATAPLMTNPKAKDPARIAAFNALLPGLIGSYGGNDVYFVDMRGALAPSDLQPDGLHPTAQGQAKIGDCWAAAILPKE
jgi:lysophospholipase L1-like esterase